MCIVNGSIPVLAEFLSDTGFEHPMAFHFVMPHPEIKGGILYKIFSIRDVNEALGLLDYKPEGGYKLHSDRRNHKSGKVSGYSGNDAQY